MQRKSPYIYADDEQQVAPTPTRLRASRPQQEYEDIQTSTRPGRASQYQERSSRPAHTTRDDSDIDTGRITRTGVRRHRPTTTYIDEDIATEQLTKPGRALAPTTQHQQRFLRREWHLHPLLWIGIGMLVLLALWAVGIRVYAWGMNTFHDPAYYTQTAHLDTATVTIDAQHTDQVRVFIDSQNHMDLLVIPDDTIGKARLVQGPMVQQVTDPQRAYITVTVQGTAITVAALGPLEVDGLGLKPDGMKWSTDLKGGK